MKVIFDIAKAELKRLFFSPVAFLLLVVLTGLMGGFFLDTTGILFYGSFAGFPVHGLSTRFFALPVMGYYEPLLKYIYLFFPVLTMNIMSRDMGSGAFKLMQSSPVKDHQIILGKYLSLVLFNVLLMVFVYTFSIYALMVIDKPEVALSLSGLLGIFFLCCAYSAIGLFLSSLTAYPIVAAIGTLCVLVFLNFVDQLWQQFPIVRDITWWFSLKGRARDFYKGLITSESVIYFLSVILFFLTLAIIRLRSVRVKRSRIQVFSQYATVTLLLCTVGYFSSLPKLKFYADVTRTKQNTLSRESQKVVSKLDGGLTLTVYVNMFDKDSYSVVPESQKRDMVRFDNYLRFKPEMKMEYVYYYKSMPGHMYGHYKGKTDAQIMDTIKKTFDISYDILPYSEVKDKADLASEGFHVVRELKRENGKKTFLRMFDDPAKQPAEREITAAMKRLVEPLPKVGFVTGHAERTSNMENDRGYSLFAQEKTFRYSLLNNGFDFENVSLMAPVPDHVDILVIADARKAFSEVEFQNYENYIKRGGNLVICGEPGREEIMNAIAKPVGVSFIPGTIMHAQPKLTQDLIPLKPVSKSIWEEDIINNISKPGMTVMMNGANGIRIDSNNQFKVFPIMTTDTIGTWNELETKDLSLDSAIYNVAAGEIKQPYLTAMIMERKVNGKDQKVFVAGDADWINNAEVTNSRKNFSSGNFVLIARTFYWLSDERVPINTTKDPFTDNKLLIGKGAWKASAITLRWAVPLLLVATGIFIWIRRKGR